MNKKQLNSLYDICRYTRAAGSDGERAMIAKHIEPIANYTDAYGNLYAMIGQPRVIYSSHTDTVHREADPMLQTVYIDEGQSRLFKGDDKMCLGADCGTGVWIMLQMIKAKVPGLYIFHRAEEIGGLGSGWIIDNPQASTDSDHEHWVQQYTQCIAFDRYGTKSIITHQGMERTCPTPTLMLWANCLAWVTSRMTAAHSPTARTTAASCQSVRICLSATSISTATRSIRLDHLLAPTDRSAQSVTRSTSSHPRAILRRSSCSNTTTGVGLLIGATTMRTLVRPN